MAIKSFNLDAEVYEEFSKHCKKHGISMSKKVENFIKKELGKIEEGNLDFKLEIEKDARERKGLPTPDEMHSLEHSMGKYC